MRGRRGGSVREQATIKKVRRRRREREGAKLLKTKSEKVRNDKVRTWQSEARRITGRQGDKVNSQQTLTVQAPERACLSSLFSSLQKSLLVNNFHLCAFRLLTGLFTQTNSNWWKKEQSAVMYRQ